MTTFDTKRGTSTDFPSRPLRVMLVNPPVLAVLEPWFDEPDFVRTSLAFLAGYLRSNSHYEVGCLDAKFERKNFVQTRDEIVAWRPDIVGLTAFTNEIKPAAYLAGLVKEKLPQTVVVAGGAHLTALPEQTMHEFPTFDIGAIGEGEHTLLELCSAIAKGESLSGVRGIVYRDQGHVVVTPPRPRILDMDSIPMPAWDLMPPAREYYIQSERGCPFACVFCMNHNGKVARKSSAERTVDEMEWLIRYAKPERISFGDELFSVDMKRTSELLDLMIARRIGEQVRWDIQTHVAYVNDDLFAKMKLANIDKCEMGVEAGDEEVLKRMGKATTREMILKAFRSAHRHGIRTGSFLLLGQPNETHRTIWNTIRMGIEVNPTEPIIGTMVPYPGTEVARMAAKGEAGYRLITTDWDEYRKQLNGSMAFVDISSTALERYQLLGYVIIFLANFRLMGLMRFLYSYRVGAINLLRKVLSGTGSAEGMLKKPDDYDKVINSPGQISMEQLADSREYWKNYQNRELKRTKELRPELMKEQMPH